MKKEIPFMRGTILRNEKGEATPIFRKSTIYWKKMIFEILMELKYFKS
jgi:hypothetical protein